MHYVTLLLPHPSHDWCIVILTRQHYYHYTLYNYLYVSDVILDNIIVCGF